MQMMVVTVNGVEREALVEPRMLLVQLLRESFRLTGTHVGCDTSQCGACVVHLNGRSVKSCTVLALSATGGTIKTIEGLTSYTTEPHPVQQAFCDHHALQCGFCTSGMIMAACAMIDRHGVSLNETLVREALDGNICRCTGYQTIVEAIVDAAGRPDHA